MPGVVLEVVRRVMRTAMIVVRWASAGPRSQGLRGHGRKAFGATVARPSGVRAAKILGLLFPVFRVLATRVANMAESVGHRRNVRNVLNRAKT